MTNEVKESIMRRLYKSAIPRFLSKEAEEALEKQIAKAPEPKERTNRYNEPVTEYFCPACGCEVDKNEDNYCSYCGQKLEQRWNRN